MNNSAVVDQVISSRRSIRCFLPKPIPSSEISDILNIASRAPSGTNMQPWKVHVITGDTLQLLGQTLTDIFIDPSRANQYQSEYAYYPTEWFEPYRSRRRKVGFDLYGILGIKKGDYEAMKKQHRKNFSFFGAPVGLMFTIDRRLELGSWLDYGMFLQNIMIASRARGIDTCPQAAFIDFHKIIAEQLGFSENEQLVCGMSMGYADLSGVENQLQTEREPETYFCTFHE